MKSSGRRFTDVHKRSQELLLAYHIDGRTHKQIGEALVDKEDTIRKRVDVAERKLREKVEKLLGKEHDRKGLATSPGFVIVFDPFDRATIRAILDVDDVFALDGLPTSSMRPRVKTNSWPWQFVPMGVLALTLFLVPGQGWRVEPLHAAKIGHWTLPAIGVRSDAPSQPAPLLRTVDPVPRKTDLRPRAILSPKDAEIIKKLHQEGSRSAQ